MSVDVADRSSGLLEQVVAARSGDPDAWAELVSRFQDLALAVALGWVGDLDRARDAAQDAFRLAVSHLGDLEEPAAFPGWFTRLVRTACSRQTRSRRPEVPLADVELAGTDDPAEVVVSGAEELRVRAAVEALPPPERAVIALHYLAGMGYGPVGEFLGIAESTARKRAHAARARLKETVPMNADLLAKARPSASEEFRDTVVFFHAVRHRDRDRVAAMLAARPALAVATEDWSPDEATRAELPPARRASALIRAVQTGDVELVRLLVEAGAPIGQACQCPGGESPLWTAAVAGDVEVAEFLLAHGADPNAAAFAGATPLHAAVQRGHHRLARTLAAAGADPELRDGHGRTAGDWALLRGAVVGRDEPDLVATGIRALDLFAPLRRGSLSYWPPAVGVGQMVLIGELADCLAPAKCWWTGFAHGAADRAAIEHGFQEANVPASLRLVPSGTDPGARRAAFFAALDELTDAPGPKFVVVQASPGHNHDVTLGLAQLRHDPEVLTVAVVEPFTQQIEPIPSAPPEGYDLVINFDRRRARANLYPAIDPATTTARDHPSERHAQLASAARAVLDEYAQIDPELELPDPGSTDSPELARMAQHLMGYLVQPFRSAEPFTSIPAERTPYPELLDSVEAILSGLPPSETTPPRHLMPS